MTTGTRLKKPRTWVAIVFSTTLWFAAGNLCGWYIGQAGGFRRGVKTMTEVLELMKDIREFQNYTRRKYTDV